jgi:hypothetical protein
VGQRIIPRLVEGEVLAMPEAAASERVGRLVVTRVFAFPRLEP